MNSSWLEFVLERYTDPRCGRGARFGNSQAFLMTEDSCTRLKPCLAKSLRWYSCVKQTILQAPVQRALHAVLPEACLAPGACQARQCGRGLKQGTGSGALPSWTLAGLLGSPESGPRRGILVRPRPGPVRRKRPAHELEPKGRAMPCRQGRKPRGRGRDGAQCSGAAGAGHAARAWPTSFPLRRLGALRAGKGPVAAACQGQEARQPASRRPRALPAGRDGYLARRTRRSAATSLMGLCLRM